jgi:hypothetical protein
MSTKPSKIPASRLPAPAAGPARRSESAQNLRVMSAAAQTTHPRRAAAHNETCQEKGEERLRRKKLALFPKSEQRHCTLAARLLTNYTLRISW